MDKDTLRRGRPSLHRQYQILATQKKLPDPAHFGISMALCGGDAALFLAFELLADSRVPEHIHTTVKQLFTNQLISTCAGQMQDIYFEALPDMPSKNDIYRLMKTKTASYTLALPLMVGAAFAGQPARTLAKLQTIGIAAGTIFQIRDDELGLLGNTEQIGKPVGSDIIEGKKTLLYYYLSKACTSGERSKTKSIFGNSGATSKDIAYVQTLVRRHNIPRLLAEEIGDLEKKALKVVGELNLDNKSRSELVSLVKFCGNRLV
jgi:geranylgeranyl diphosphate synthase type I